MNQEENAPNKNIYEHPHAVIVRQQIKRFLTRLENAYPTCSMSILDDHVDPILKGPREHFRLNTVVNDEYSVRPIVVKTERRAHLPPERRKLGGFYNAYTASVHALPFFRMHNNDRYYWEDSLSDFWVNNISSELFDCLRSLETYCVFKVCALMPEVGVPTQGKPRMRIYICLREEYFASRDYDFIACIRIDSPNEAARSLRNFFAKNDKSRARELFEETC